MLQCTADFQNDAAGIDEQRCPAGSVRAGHQDFTGEQLLIGRMAEHFDAALYHAGGDGHTGDFHRPSQWSAVDSRFFRANR